MNIQNVQRKNRKAISPVLATVILIAITLIAAVAIAGFVFGLFGTFTSTAQVSASAQSCASTAGAAPEVCNIVLTNNGNSNTQTSNACSVTWAGVGHTGVFAPATTNIVPGTPLPGTCTVAGGFAPAGLQVTGYVILSNGANALWSVTSSP